VRVHPAPPPPRRRPTAVATPKHPDCYRGPSQSGGLQAPDRFHVLDKNSTTTRHSLGQCKRCKGHLHCDTMTELPRHWQTETRRSAVQSGTEFTGICGNIPPLYSRLNKVSRKTTGRSHFLVCLTQNAVRSSETSAYVSRRLHVVTCQATRFCNSRALFSVSASNEAPFDSLTNLATDIVPVEATPSS
jgi:hypothetical protein